jgi:hypothetical protein
MNKLNLTKQSQVNLKRWLIGLLFFVTTLYYFAGLPGIPFHPDESTYLFMSSDFRTIFTDPSSLFWQSSLEGNIKQHYRELDAPITRDLIGAGLLIGGYPSLLVDWNWSNTWNQNIQAGALPDSTQLLIGRASVAWLFPFSLVLMFSIGKKLRYNLFGLFSAVLFASNALVLLHTRRAMEESVLAFGVCLSLWGILNSEKKPWIAVVGAAIAFNTKQSAIALAPVALLAICWPYLHPASIKRILIRVGLFLAIFSGITLLLNPFLFSNPIQAAKAAIQARQGFISQQVDTLQSIAAEQVLYSPGERILALIAQLYILPPAVEDVGNYEKDIAPAKAAYFQQPGMDLFRGLVWGSIFLALTFLGVIVTVLRILRRGLQSEKRYALLLLAYLLQILVLIITIPIPYQRYWIPLIPFTCVWILLAMFEISRVGKQILKPFLHR